MQFTLQNHLFLFELKNVGNDIKHNLMTIDSFSWESRVSYN